MQPAGSRPNSEIASLGTAHVSMLQAKDTRPSYSMQQLLIKAYIISIELAAFYRLNTIDSTCRMPANLAEFELPTIDPVERMDDVEAR
jgi:hypothetical protein